MHPKIKYIEDPNAVNLRNQHGENTITNAVANYQDMNIFAELTASRRGRSVIVTGEGMQKTGTEKTLKVNFIGNNQNKNNYGDDNDINNPNYLNFTTNYYDGSTPDNQIQYESFGITSIKVVINSSYVPQVNIQFVDIRGLSFFNQENSPYRILFDFPPPIFNLKIKGYYGKPLEYNLHLVKYTTEFKAENGNFVIDAQFVALTFAPLSDVLFRYVINFPLMIDGISNPEPNQPPKNTNELILKIKSLYSSGNTPIDTDIENQEFKNVSATLTTIQDAIITLSGFKNILDGNSYAFVNDITENDLPKITQLANNNIYGYNEYIKSMTNLDKPETINQRLCIGYIGNGSDKNTIYEKLSDYRTTKLLITTIKINGGIIDTDVSEPQTIYNYYNLSTKKTNISGTNPLAEFKTTYYIIDITNYYVKLYKNKKIAEDTKQRLGESMALKINNNVESILGMKPTIYNIFKLILDDVDTFFKILRDTSKAAYDHHNKQGIKEVILNNNLKDSGDENVEIFEFPLLIKNVTEGCSVTEVKASPMELNSLLPSDPFPELKLIENFITTFSNQKIQTEQYLAKANENEDGEKRWIPISPIDSTLAGIDGIATPYLGRSNLSEMFNVFLKRFYILTQSSLPINFYKSYDGIKDTYVELYSKSEALNLTMSLLGNEKLIMSVQEAAKKYSQNIDDFYTFLDTNVTEQYAFTSGNPIVIDNSYIDKENPNYIGLNIYREEISTQSTDVESGDGLIDKFTNEIQKNIFQTLFAKDIPNESYLFTDDNILYIKDTFVRKNEEKSNKLADYQGIPLETRFLCDLNQIYSDNTFLFNKSRIIFYSQAELFGGVVTNKFHLLSDDTIKDKESFLKEEIPLNGNHAIKIDVGGAVKLRNFQNIIDVWVDVLSKNDVAIYNDVISPNASDVLFISTIILSNFGYTLGPYNNYPNYLQMGVFLNPAAIQVPLYLPAYIGALVDADTNGLKEKLENFYLTGGGKDINSCGVFTLADIKDINTHMSDKDKEKFYVDYDSFMTDGTFAKIKNGIQDLYNRVQSENPKDEDERKKLYKKYLEPDGDTYFTSILAGLMRKLTIVCFSQSTFSNEITPTQYSSLKSIRDSDEESNKRKQEINDTFFKSFFISVDLNIETKNEKQKEIEEENKKLLGDDDIITQLYYSFKNTNDKWLCNPISEPLEGGYPFNGEKDLIDSFVFVDRVMRPIGNTNINPEILLDLFEDTNISVFSVLSQLLSLNGFLFFPLQNFIVHSDESWEDSFKMNPNMDTTQQEAFVCLYAGGSSSYPNNLKNGFQDDGIVDIATTDAIDFNTGCDDYDNYDDENDKQIKRNSEYNKSIFNKVRAFRVMFGQQNQSMFTDIKIDSKEYPETSESLKILSRLAGDGAQSPPTPKGQNLYNLYENRAYGATITGLGNAMIQPTQYFQLDNVPLFNGAYLITGVEHNMTANKMETNFTGTKILKYPIPRVTTPAASMKLLGDFGQYVKPDSNLTTPATEATMITDDRLNELNTVLGVDVSNYQRNVDWNKAVKSGVKFAFIKVTEGTWFYDENSANYELLGNINRAIGNGVKIGYYHFARPGSSTDPAADATEEANWFLSKVELLPKPSFPLVLDVESFIDKAYETKRKPVAWTNRKASMPIYIRTFIDVLKDGGYDTIIYSYSDFLNSNGVTDFSKYPLWLANYMNIRKGINPETHLPSVPKGWQSKSDEHIPWSTWQFTSQGQVAGISGRVDMNVMKKDFFDNYV